MPTRFLVAGLYFFALAALVAIVVAVLAPIDAIRFLGVVALACAGLGFLIQLYALQKLDPQTSGALRARLRIPLDRMRALGSSTARTYTQATHSTSRSVW